MSEDSAVHNAAAEDASATDATTADSSAVSSEPLLADDPAALIPQHEVETTELGFRDLQLEDGILDVLDSIGFEHPTPIQAAVIPHALRGDDLIGLAETGSGKTAAFSLPMAQLLVHRRGMRGVIMCPTREIALQTKAFLDLFGKSHNLRTVCLIGGVKIGPQIDALRKAADIAVATPGRLLDHLERRTIRLDRVENLVLDEADHMLDLGFLPQIQAVLKALPTDRQTMMFSATMPPPIERLTQRFLRDPVRVDLSPQGTATGIEHRLYMCNERDKKDCILALLQQDTGSTLVFTRRKSDAEWLTRVLEKADVAVARIHSDRSQQHRVRALEDFRRGKSRVLVATDIAARGIDVPGIEHIVNYDLPGTVEDYIHRSGRTARAHREGVVSSIATWMDKALIKQIERALGEPLPRCTVEGVEPYVELTSARQRRARSVLRR